MSEAFALTRIVFFDYQAIWFKILLGYKSGNMFFCRTKTLGLGSGVKKITQHFYRKILGYLTFTARYILS